MSRHNCNQQQVAFLNHRIAADNCQHVAVVPTRVEVEHCRVLLLVATAMAHHPPPISRENTSQLLNNLSCLGQVVWQASWAELFAVQQRLFEPTAEAKPWLITGSSQSRFATCSVLFKIGAEGMFDGMCLDGMLYA